MINSFDDLEKNYNKKFDSLKEILIKKLSTVLEWQNIIRSQKFR